MLVRPADIVSSLFDDKREDKRDDNEYDNIECYDDVPGLFFVSDDTALRNLPNLCNLPDMCAVWHVPDVRPVSPFVSAVVLFFFFSFRGKGRNN